MVHDMVEKDFIIKTYKNMRVKRIDMLFIGHVEHFMMINMVGNRNNLEKSTQHVNL